MVENAPEKKEFPSMKPMAYFGGNLLLGGLSYILLRQYVRFFIFIVVVFAASFLSPLEYLIVFASAFDAYFIAKKLKAKQIPEPAYNSVLTWIIVAVWILSIIGFIALSMSGIIN